jgi:hypothetical protein
MKQSKSAKSQVGLALPMASLSGSLIEAGVTNYQVRVSIHSFIVISGGSGDWKGTYERVSENAVLLEDGHGKREMLFDHPLHKLLVREMRLAMVSDGVFQALAFSLLSHFVGLSRG